MNAEWIKDLIAVIETGSIAKAAYVRSISQPAFSRRVQVIEGYLGKELIDRTVKPAKPKSELLSLYQEMKDISQKIRLLEGALSQTASFRNLVTLAAQHSTAVALGPTIVEQCNRLERVSVNLRSENHDKCLILLMRQQVDIIIIYADPEEEANYIEYSSAFESKTISVDQLIPVYSAKHPARIDKAIEKRMLPIINYPPESFLGEIMTKHVLSQLLNTGDLQIFAETALTLAAKNLALAGVGVAWVPRPLVEMEIEREELIDVSGILPTVSLPLIACRAISATDKVTEAWSALLHSMQHKVAVSNAPNKKNARTK